MVSDVVNLHPYIEVYRAGVKLVPDESATGDSNVIGVPFRVRVKLDRPPPGRLELHFSPATNGKAVQVDIMLTLD